MSRTCCQITDAQFDEGVAKQNLKDYLSRGPAKHTKLILQAVRSLRLKNASLLDVGGGIGIIHHELMQDVVERAVHVDASSAYLKIAKEESAKRGAADAVQFIHADFTDVETEIEEVDIVTLDRVVCCYPDFQRLLTAAGRHGRRALALTYPQETWYFKAVSRLANFVQRLRKDPFRVFIHPVAQMESLLRELGFARTQTKRIFLWEMSLYEKK
ncbi:MAG: class I SAM-dependent methyltransferase [Anaerolineales bacterium]|nr:class I SAM-dependent methyltransferase [Anaerolineales bacterium]